MKLPNPSQIRDSRIEHLIFITKGYLDGGGSSVLLFDKIEKAAFKLWPSIRSKTRREYAESAHKVILSSSLVEPEILPEMGSPRGER